MSAANTGGDRCGRSTAAPAECSTVARKAKPRRQGEVDRGCLSGAVGLPVMPTLQPTDVAVGSQNVDEGPGRVSFRTVREGRRVIQRVESKIAAALEGERRSTD